MGGYSDKGSRMIHPRIAVLPLSILAALACFHASAQSVVSTRSGTVYFFEGRVFVGDQPLTQKFGKFPDIGEGGELRTEHGRAEVLLTPGVFLRVDENSAIRMLSNQLSDTRVELLSGSAILEANEAAPDRKAKLIYKDWRVRVPQRGVYRIDAEPAQLRVYKGDVEVSTEGQTELVSVKAGEVLPFAEVLVPEQSTTADGNDFKNWAMSRSQAVSADDATAAAIVDDPNQLDTAGLPAGGGFSYFPPTGLPSLGITNPYGLSFWSPYQSALSPIYYPSYIYGPRYLGWPVSPGLYPLRTSPYRVGTGLHIGGGTIQRAPLTPLRPSAPRLGVRGVGGHR